MMRPNLNRRGCLIFVIVTILALAAILWLARQAAPPPARDAGPPQAIDKQGLASS